MRGVGTLLLAACLLWAGGVRGGVVVEDDLGHRFEAQAPVRRVVSLAPFITELVYAVGAQQLLVGVSEYSDHPPAARSLKRVANAFAVDYESILALRPDVVLTWGSGMGYGVRRRLTELGLEVVTLEPRLLADVARSLRLVGRLTGRGREGEQRALEFEGRIARLRARYAGSPIVRVFYQIADRPIMTLNGGHLVSEVIALCGGSNVFRELAPLAPVVSLEEVVLRDPDVVIVSSELRHQAAVIERWAALPGFRPARDGHLYATDSDLLDRQTPRLVQGAEQLCELLDRVRTAAQ